MHLLQYSHLNILSIAECENNRQGFNSLNVLTKLFFIVCLRTSYKICLNLSVMTILGSLISVSLFLLVPTFLIFLALVSGLHFAYAQVNNTNSTESVQNMSVKITLPKENQTIPVGELIVYGISSDTPESNCQVYVDWNDIKPMQNVTGMGPGGKRDFSKWMFTYDNNYHLITAGSNELTSKITCFGNSDLSNLTSKYNSINVTGSTDLTTTAIPAAADNQTIHNSTTGFKGMGPLSILPQYLATSTNNTLLDDELESNKSKDDTSTKNFITDVKKDNKAGKSQSIDHLLSMKIEKNSDGPDDIQVKLRSSNFNSDSDSIIIEHKDLNKYIRSLIKEKLERVSERLLD